MYASVGTGEVLWHRSEKTGEGGDRDADGDRRPDAWFRRIREEKKLWRGKRWDERDECFVIMCNSLPQIIIIKINKQMFNKNNLFPSIHCVLYILFCSLEFSLAGQGW